MKKANYRKIIAARAYKLPDVWLDTHIPKMVNDLFKLIKFYYSQKTGSNNRSYFTLGMMVNNLRKNEEYKTTRIIDFMFNESAKNLWSPNEPNINYYIDEDLYNKEAQDIQRLPRAEERSHNFYIAFYAVDDSSWWEKRFNGTFHRRGKTDEFVIDVNLPQSAKLIDIVKDPQPYIDRIETTLKHELTHAHAQWSTGHDPSTQEGRDRFIRQTEDPDKYRNTQDEAMAWTQNLTTKVKQWLRTADLSLPTNELVRLFLDDLEASTDRTILNRVRDGHRKKYLQIIYNYIEESK